MTIEQMKAAVKSAMQAGDTTPLQDVYDELQAMEQADEGKRAELYKLCVDSLTERLKAKNVEPGVLVELLDVLLRWQLGRDPIGN